MSAPISAGQLAPIKDALFAGRKIDAIKLYREATGAALTEAKDAIEKLEQELRVASPEKFTAAPAGKGCSAIVLAMFAFLLIAVFVVRTFCFKD